MALAAAVRMAVSSLVEDRMSLIPTRCAWRISSPDSWRRMTTTEMSGVPCWRAPARASASRSAMLGPKMAASTSRPSAATAAMASSGSAARTTRSVSPDRALVASQVA